MSNPIAEAYARRVKRGSITIDDVPAPMQTAVKEILEKNEKDNGSKEV